MNGKMRGGKKSQIQLALSLALLCVPLHSLPTHHAEVLDTKYETNEAEIETALRVFEGKSLTDVFLFLDEVRPKINSIDVKERRGLVMRAVAAATASGVITKSQIRRFQQRFAPILKLHNRENTLSLVIFQDDTPSVMNHKGALVAISSKSIELAESDAGLAGLIAHEVAHDYLSLSQIIDKLDTDMRCDREIELVCDGIAVATLLRLGLDPMAYAVALSNNILSSSELRRLNRGDLLYPSLQARVKMIRLVSAQFKQSRPVLLPRG